MNVATVLKSFAAASILFLAALPVAAQDYSAQQDESQDSLREVLRGQMKERMMRLALGYWEPRLNVYKLRIDDMFSGGDLEKLNELRVRFGILMERVAQEQAEQEKRYAEISAANERAEAVAVAESATPAEVDTVAVAVADDANVAVVDAPDTAVAVDDSEDGMTAVGEPVAVDPEEDARLEREREQARQQEHEAKMREREEALARGEDVSDDFEQYNRYQEMSELPAIAKWLARSYRPGLDNLADVVVADLGRFADTLDTFTERFCTEHAADIARVPGLREELVDMADSKEIHEAVRYPRSFKKMYLSRTESFVLLYNGAGLAKIMGVATGKEAPVAMPESSMLAQNTPNPATTVTSVSYTLPAASTATTVRVFDANGEIVLERNEGALPAGAHQIQLNVEDLRSGWYLYQLSATLPTGETICSKVMHVTR